MKPALKLEQLNREQLTVECRRLRHQLDNLEDAYTKLDMAFRSLKRELDNKKEQLKKLTGEPSS